MSPSPSRGGPLPSQPILPPLFPALYLTKGKLVFPGAGGMDQLVALRDPDGREFDVFDTADLLLGRYQRLYVVDVEGVRYRRPQFEYLQEIAQGKEMWVDAGPRNVDEVMDVLVAGATKAVLSTSTLQGSREIARTLKMTPQVALEIVVRGRGTLSADPSLRDLDPVELAREARAAGVSDVILSTQGPDLDLPLVKELAAQGPTYLGTPFHPSQGSILTTYGLAGGIFSAMEVLGTWTTSGS